MDEIVARAQERRGGMPAQVAAALREIGPVFNEEVLNATRELYRPLLEAASRDGVEIATDLSYGPDKERHLLDVHVPTPAPTAPAPVVMFFHGGGFVGGHKNAMGPLSYGNVANFFARNGLIGVNGTYRLAPAHKWPEGARDVGAALAWVRANIAEYGGDPSLIYLMGHSAGASHVATYALRPELHPADGAGIAGAIVMSGVHETRGLGGGGHPYYGDDAAKYAEMDNCDNAVWGDFDLYLSAAELDPFRFQRSAVRLASALADRTQRMPHLRILPHHNHPSQTLSFLTGDETISADVLDFVLSSAASRGK